MLAVVLAKAKERSLFLLLDRLELAANLSMHSRILLIFLACSNGAITDVKPTRAAALEASYRWARMVLNISET